MQNQAFHRRKAQSGNVLWYILIVIGLLAGLTFMMTRSGSKMSSNLDSDKVALTAERIARDLSAIDGGIQRLVSMNGCLDSQLNFANTVVTGYTNASAPPDHRCDVYDPAGAGLSYIAIPANSQSTDPFFSASHDGWNFTAAISVPGVGPEYATQSMCTENCAELIVWQNGFTEEICRQYNVLAGLGDGTPPLDSDDALPTPFTGSFGQGNTGASALNVGSGDKDTALYAKKTGCFRLFSSSPANYIIYKVLIAR